MITSRKTANAVGGKTARACDGCLRKRARWFCSADDAFLCQGCDASVHSANQLASRHERVRLEASGSSSLSFSKAVPACSDHKQDIPPAWHKGFTRKARTPRTYNNNKLQHQQQHTKDHKERNLNPLPLVPEIGCEEEGSMTREESEEQLLYRVPVFDPFSAGLCDDTVVDDVFGQDDLDGLPGFLPSDVDLAEFAADVESLLGSGLDEDCSDGTNKQLVCKEEKLVKVKDEVQEVVRSDEGCQFDEGFDMIKESLLDWDLDADGEDVAGVVKEEEKGRLCNLRLNYEAVITAWDSQGCPWTTGTKPEINPDHPYWPDFMGTCPKDVNPYGGLGHGVGNDGGREARVLRYKEKRRTRLFSKKIRYEVRKLNAEKRPRMKGRFVKRAPSSFMGAASFSLPY